MNNLELRNQRIGRLMPEPFQISAHVVILLGPPGAGKGTQAQRIAAGFGLQHLSTGDMLRDNLARDTELGREARPIMERGELVPDHIVLRMVQDRIAQADCQKGFILDGFPRTLPQARGLERICRRYRSASTTVLNLAVQPEVLARRLANRRICRAKGHIYNLTDRPPARAGFCDVDDSELMQRPDDRESVVRERLQTYECSTRPLVDFYASRGLLVPVNGEGAADDVTANLTRVLGGAGKG